MKANYPCILTSIITCTCIDEVVPGRQGLTLRGLKALELRVQRHAENAGRIASALASHRAVTGVYYPGLPDHPGHQVAKQQMTGFGGMLSFELDGTAERLLIVWCCLRHLRHLRP